jgi:hypothetical protein
MLAILGCGRMNWCTSHNIAIWVSTALLRSVQGSTYTIMVLIGYTWENDAYSWQDHVEASLAQPAMSGPQNWQEEGTPRILSLQIGKRFALKSRMLCRVIVRVRQQFADRRPA